jgi:hypothetical protein
MASDVLHLGGARIVSDGAAQTRRSTTDHAERGKNSRLNLTPRKLFLLAAVVIGTCQSVFAQGAPGSAPGSSVLSRA